MINQDIFASRLKMLREQRKVSLEEVAEKIGTTKVTLSRYENSSREPKLSIIYNIAKYFDVEVDWLIGYENENPNRIEKIYNKLNQKRQAKVYDFAMYQLKEQQAQYVEEESHFVTVYGKTAAGEPITYGDSTMEERSVKHVPLNAECALVVQGDSMEPVIKDGSIVFYKKTVNLENGEIGIFEIEGDGVTCKKIKYDFENKKIILQSLNSDYEDMVLNQSQVRILGKVLN